MLSSFSANRPERLKHRKEFLAVARANRKWAAPSMVVQAMQRPETAATATVRVGFTASKKVGNAVARNRTKRRLRACVDQLAPTLAAPGTDLVVIGRKSTEDRRFSELLRDFKLCLRKVGALRTEAALETPDAR